jgi:hypothetical protein
MNNYGKLTTTIVVGWFLFVLSGSALHLFRNDSQRIGLDVAIAALSPIIVFSLWFAGSESFRRFALSLDPGVLTSVHSLRLLGLVFLLEAHDVLPALFALPAGYGDMALGATAAFVAWKLANPAHRNAFILWQVLGIIDLVMAVGLGTTAPLLDPHSIPMVAMTILPLSIIPTFLVPLFVILHVICIAQARTWRIVKAPSRQSAKPIQHPAI